MFAFLLKAPVMLWKLSSLCRKYSISVINPHFVGLEYFPLVVLRMLGIFRGKFILSFHGLDIVEMRQSRGLERWLSKVLLRKADWLVACSTGLRNEILLFVPECASRVLAIPNGIDAGAFLSLAGEPFELPAKVRNRRVLLSIGSYEPKKGHDTLLHAFAKVREKGCDAALVIAGQGSSRTTAELARELGILEDVVFLENLPHAQIAALMQRADLFVLPSRWEPFGLVLLEAAVAQKPVVVTDTAGASDLVRHGDTGVVVPIDNPDALASAISATLADSEGASSMARRFHDHVLENFTWQLACRRYLQLAGIYPQVDKD
jgi:glycosyltransferase involved in cell wall biosynthesis